MGQPEMTCGGCQSLALPRQLLSQKSPAFRAINTAAMTQDPFGRIINVASSPRVEPSPSASPLASPSPSANRLGQGYLLGPWIAEQERLRRESEEAATEKRGHALFVEHLLLSMLCSEDLELPEKSEPVATDPAPDPEAPEAPEAPKLMTLPWARFRQVTQWEGCGLRMSAVEKIQVDGAKNKTISNETAHPGLEEEEAID